MIRPPIRLTGPTQRQFCASYIMDVAPDGCVVKAQAYTDAAAEFEERALSADEVLAAAQREFLINLGMSAQRSAKAMREDAEALTTLLGAGAP